MLTKQDKADIVEIVTDVINDTIMPAVGEMSDKFEKRMDNLDSNQFRMEQKLDRLSADSLDNKSRLVKHDEDIKALSQAVFSKGA